MESTGLNQPDRFDPSIQRIESTGMRPTFFGNVCDDRRPTAYCAAAR
jgi:hypothetical protein